MHGAKVVLRSPEISGRGEGEKRERELEGAYLNSHRTPDKTG